MVERAGLCIENYVCIYTYMYVYVQFCIENNGCIGRYINKCMWRTAREGCCPGFD